MGMKTVDKLYSRRIADEVTGETKEPVVEAQKSPEPVKETEPAPLPKEERKEEIKKFNENPVTKANKVVAMKKGTYKTLIGIIILLTAILIANFVWFNLSLSSGKMNGNVTVTNNIQVDPPVIPEIPVDVDANINNQYTHTIQNTIEVDDSTIKEIVDDIVEDILKGLNETI